MTQIGARPWVAVALLAATLVYVGCSGTTQDATSKGGATTPVKTSGGGWGAGSRLLADWRDPKAILLISGEQDGYMEPCGCSEGQSGGLIRRYDLIERLHKQNLPTAQIDLGSLIKDPISARGGLEQTKIKFDYALKALKLLEYDALALSAEDLKLGIGETLGHFMGEFSNARTKILAANVKPEASYENLFRPSIIINVGTVKLGVTSVTDPETVEKLADPDKSQFLPTIQPPSDVLLNTLADLEPKSDFQVLMVQGPPELARRLATAYPGFDIVVATSESDHALNRNPELFNDGKTMLVTVGKKGQEIGVFGFFPGETPAKRYTLIPLDGKYDGPATAMKKLIEDEYRETLKIAGIVESYPKHGNPNAPQGATYAGAQSCRECHPNTFAKWAGTKHAQGFTSLLNDKKPNTAFDAECVTCHTTGFEYTSGWRSQTLTPNLAGNQCENCHGPGSRHNADPDNPEFRKALALNIASIEKTHRCNDCHDGENSVHFEFAKYWPLIEHKGLDHYADSKVHRKATPKTSAIIPDNASNR
jgi:hypothetical protein